MKTKDFLAPANTAIERRATDKGRLLNDLAGRAAASLGLPAERIFAALSKREALGSTGTGAGVAIPHARMPEVAKPFGILLRLEKPIDFESIDQRKVDIVFLLLLPEKAPGEPLNALACAARALRDPDIVRNIRDATDNAALYRAVTA